MGTPVLPGKQLSSSLKERLKKCGRYYKSPVVPKRLCPESTTSPSMGASSLGQPIPFPESDLSEASGSKECISPGGQTPRSSRSRSQPVARLGAAVCDSEKVVNSPQNSTSKSIPNRLKSRMRKSPSTDSSHCGLARRLTDDSKLNCTPKSKRARISQGTPEIAECEPDIMVSPTVHSGSSSCTSTPSTSQSSTSICAGTPSRPKETEEPVPSCSSTQSADTETLVDLQREKARLAERIKLKTEQLRQLKMVKLYREKNDLQDLGALATKWRGVAQEAIQRLWELAPEPKPTLAEIIDHFQLDHKFLHYDSDDEAFLDP